MEKDEDPWEILGVPRDASEAEIKKAFRKGALKYHPDKQQTDEDREAAQGIFSKFSAAYETLNDPVKRYDWKQAEEQRLSKASRRPPAKTMPRKQPASPGTPPHQRTPPSGAPNSQKTSGNKSQKRPSGAPRAGRPSAGPNPADRPSSKTGNPSPSHQGTPPPGKRAGATPSSTKSTHSPTPPVGRKSTSAASQRKSSAATPRDKSPKRTTAPVNGQKRPTSKEGAEKRTSPPMSMGWQRRAPQKVGKQPEVKKYRDPFDIFDSVMKEEFGDDYKTKEESGWKGSIGVPGLAKVNPFKKKSESSHKEFKKLDINNDKSLSKDELCKYIESHSDLWSTLGRNLNLPVKKCIDVATDVAFSLAFGEGKTRPKNNEHRKRHELSEAEFKYFHKNYVMDEKGSHEFFLRTIFSVFDLNNDGVLNAKELDKFLDIFYKAKDVFKGNMKLPEKKHLLKIVGTRLDENRDGVLQFDEIRDLLEVAAVVSTDK